MAAKQAKTTQINRTAKIVRGARTAGSRHAGAAKPTPSFPQRSASAGAADPWRTPIAKDFAVPRNTVREPNRTGGGPALTITRGGGAKTSVGGTSARVRADRVERKGKVVVKKPTKKPRVVLTDDEDTAMVVNKKNLKMLAKLVKLQLEGKPIVKRKQYPARSSTIVRVPNAILGLVQQQITAYRLKKKSESTK